MALLCVPPVSTVCPPGRLSGKSRARARALQGLRGSAPPRIHCLMGTSPEEMARINDFASLGRHSFPIGFTFGASSSAYQVEGGWNEGGKGPSIWDTFCHKHPEKIVDGSNADDAIDSYHLYREDVRNLKHIGMDAYRFSISWPRILPKGTLQGGVNPDGIAYYKNLIDEMTDNGMMPFVTLFHWDVPQALEDEYGGFLDKRIVNDFKDYCELCFKEFGDKVKHWITLNEPWVFCTPGYSEGSFPPGRCSKDLGCPAGDSVTEPYKVMYHLILAHATAARLYKDKYQPKQEGQVGISLAAQWYEPYRDEHHHIEAANRAMDFWIGWFMEPLVYGDYPFSMKTIVRERLPCFTEEESIMVKGSYDFIGINYYTARYARNVRFSIDEKPVYCTQESYAEELVERDGIPIGPSNGSTVYMYPNGLKKFLFYLKERYGNPRIYITENGIGEFRKQDDTIESALNDKIRIGYLWLHLSALHEAISDGANLQGYFVWSLLDSFEWTSGYTLRYGLVYVDFKRGFKRNLKSSAKWFAKFLQAT